MLTKTAHAQMTKKIAHIDTIDTQNAIELGFRKTAHELNLTQEQFERAYKVACEIAQSAHRE